MAERLIVWCGLRKGREHIIPDFSNVRPATLWILVVSSYSCNVIGGSILGNHLANIVLPEPGGPMRIILCPPAAEISRQRLMDS